MGKLVKYYFGGFYPRNPQLILRNIDIRRGGETIGYPNLLYTLTEKQPKKYVQNILKVLFFLILSFGQRSTF